MKYLRALKERLHHSLGAKMFRRIFVFSFILGLFTFFISFALYLGTILDDYGNVTKMTAEATWKLIDQDAAMDCMKEILALYRDSNPEPLTSSPDVGIMSRTLDGADVIKGEKYEEIRSHMTDMCAASSTNGIYLAIIDNERNNVIYVIDVDIESAAAEPGTYTGMFQDVSLNAGERTGRNDYFILNRGGAFGFVCCNRHEIASEGNYQFTIYCDVDLQRVMLRGLSFMAAYVAVLLLLTLVMTSTFVWIINLTVVTPVNKLAVAAGSYSTDRHNDIMTNSHFKDLHIRTGDEIENLSHVLDEMESIISVYYTNMLKTATEQERLNSEMEIAERIQAGMLPSQFPPFPALVSCFDIYATMDPAKEVGGDFYDFFMLDEDHMAFLIADVSGKGIPGALFMMVSKIMILNHARMIGNDPAAILEAVNDSIMANNPAEMFVTVWLAIMELSTGHVVAANAGHEYPFIRRAGGQFELLKDRHGMVLGGMEGMKYRNYEIQLAKGDVIYVYTDGAPEANNPEGEMFGTDRIAASLNQDPERSMEKLLKDANDDIASFVKNAEQFDDITMLGLRYYGEMPMNEMTIEATLSNIQTVTDFVDRKLEEHHCPMKTMTQINIAVDELFSNIARYAYRPGVGPATVRVEVEKNPLTVIITFIDNGRPYDPLSGKDPDVTLTAEEREIGGLGVFLVRKMMDDVTYEYKDGRNILRVRHVLEK